MLRRTSQIVSYLILSLLVGIVITLLTDELENVAVQKRIEKTLENNIKNAVFSFKESAGKSTSLDEKVFIRRIIATVMQDKVSVFERGPGVPPETRPDELFLFTLDGSDYTLDFYVRKQYLRSELAILDVPDYLSGITATIIIFAFIVYYTESKRRAKDLRQEMEVKHAEMDSELRRHEALALLGRMSAALAHELKTPVATISNLVQTFPSRRTDEQFVNRFLALTREELNRTQQLIDNLLAYGKEIDIRNSEWIPVEPFLKATASDGMSLEIQQHFEINGDRFYLELLFKNLIRNSHEAGADTFRIRVHIPPQDATIRAEIICEDNGGGFSQGADLERLLDPFATSRSRGGGLGLYLAKKIATAHGGMLSLARMAEGAQVVLALPQNRIRVRDHA